MTRRRDGTHPQNFEETRTMLHEMASLQTALERSDYQDDTEGITQTENFPERMSKDDSRLHHPQPNRQLSPFLGDSWVANSKTNVVYLGGVARRCMEMAVTRRLREMTDDTEMASPQAELSRGGQQGRIHEMASPNPNFREDDKDEPDGDQDLEDAT
ncbi:hypothetical protein AVEN_84118-1 [Araneus ventricosus]|uniref:Uncharacterized protein n=1 Tax=Araneus ventricosus TaxID=182803 RepID=A0A4Y2RWS8_ARAVE|nr:hypothetical protein AVEN_84118-1 [Araneus ventricosus]